MFNLVITLGLDKRQGRELLSESLDINSNIRLNETVYPELFEILESGLEFEEHGNVICGKGFELSEYAGVPGTEIVPVETKVCRVNFL